jgi:hypothetical protein
MMDNLDPNEPRTPKTRETPVERPLADREVPLTGRPGAATLNAWLDGEMPESAARHGEMARDVDFWKRMDRELSVRRAATTPSHIFGQIMAALPSTAPAAASKWYQKPMAVNPLVAAAAAAGTLALGIALGAALSGK